MECNRDEALRAMEIAQTKFSVQDFSGARKFLLKALQLFPALEGISQMLAVVQVHVISQARHPGSDHDLYALLQVDPSADDNIVRKQYRKLALILHPDKNKSLGAEAAFKLVREAWSVLSDKEKRTLYNQKRGISAKVNQKSQSNGNHNSDQDSSLRPCKTDTFWTACTFCAVQYQYFRKYENCHLLCQRCKKGYVGRDEHVPRRNASHEKAGDGGNWVPEQQNSPNCNLGGSFSNEFVNGNSHAGRDTRTSATAGKNGGANPAAAEFVRQIYQKTRKERLEAQKEQRRKEREKEKQERDREKEERKRVRESQRKQKEEKRKREVLLKVLMKQRGIEERAAASFTKMEICNSKRKKYESDENFKETLSGKSMSFEDHPTASEEELKADVCRFSQMRKNSPDELEGIIDGDTKSFAGLKKPKIEFDTSESEKPKIKNRKALASQSSNYILQNVLESPNMYGCSLQRSSSSSGHDRGMEEEQVRSRAYMEDQGFHKAELAEKCKVLLSYRVLQNSALGNQFLGNKNEELAIDSCDKTKSAMAYKEHSMNKQSHAKKKVPSPTMQPPSSSTQPEECNTQIGLETCPSTFSKCSDKDTTFLYVSVPDADFHNFDADRTEKDMFAGQVWAAYDDKDGMPRFYCRILKVLSIAPFKVRVRWLEPHPSCAEVNKWLAANHILTCGVFKNGSATETLDQINVFSHVMLTAIGQKGLMRIYPKRGEIWATYKRWSLNWLQPTTEDCTRTYEYDMVEVISDFSEKMGVYAIRLAKAQGFRTLYKRENEMASQNFMCLPEEIFRFSHRIPAHKMTGGEAPDLPEGCWELDPASTPLDLLCSQK